MERLSNPNVLDLEEGRPVSLLVTRSVLGELVIRPKVGPGALLVRALRLFLGPPWSTLGIPYIDVTGGHLIETLLPHLVQQGDRPRLYLLAAYGQGAGKRYSVRFAGVPGGPEGQGVENALEAVPAVGQ
jgi:hypothetical protein